MRKAGWHPQLPPVRRRKLCGNVATISGRSVPDIDGHVQDRSSCAANQLSLGARRSLKMQSPQHAPFGRVDMIVLDEFHLYAYVRKNITSIRFRKEATFIAAPGGHDH